MSSNNRSLFNTGEKIVINKNTYEIKSIYNNKDNITYNVIISGISYPHEIPTKIKHTELIKLISNNKNAHNIKPTNPSIQEVPSVSSSNRKPLTQNNLNKINSYDARQNLLLKHNFVFYGTIMAAIAAKNKLDFPPFGPKSESNRKFQNEKIKLLLQAIIEKTTSGTGYKTPYPLAEVGAYQGVAIAGRAAASKVMGTGRWFSGTGGTKKSYTKSDLIKIAKKHKISLITKTGEKKLKEELFKSLKRKNLVK